MVRCEHNYGLWYQKVSIDTIVVHAFMCFRHMYSSCSAVTNHNVHFCWELVLKINYTYKQKRFV